MLSRLEALYGSSQTCLRLMLLKSGAAGFALHGYIFTSKEGASVYRIIKFPSSLEPLEGKILIALKLHPILMEDVQICEDSISLV